MYTVAVRDRCADQDAHDFSSWLTELSDGHCVIHPIPEIELPPEQSSVSSSTSPSQTCLDSDQNSAEENLAAPDHVNVVIIPSSSDVPERVPIHIV